MTKLIPIESGSNHLLPAGCTSTISVTMKHRGVAHRLYFRSAIGDRFRIDEVRVGIEPVSPGTRLVEVADQAQYEIILGDLILLPGMDVSVTVTNLSGADAEFRASLALLSQPPAAPRPADMMHMAPRAFGWGPISPGAAHERTVMRRMETATLYADRIYVPCSVGDCFTITRISFDQRFDYDNPGYRIVDIAGRPQYEFICARRDEIWPGCAWTMKFVNHTNEPRYFEASLGLVVEPTIADSQLRACRVQLRAQIAQLEEANDLQNCEYNKTMDTMKERIAKLQEEAARNLSAKRIGQLQADTQFDQLSFGGTVQQYKEKFG